MSSIVTASLTNFFGLLGALLVLAFVANRLSKWTRVPDVIVLLAYRNRARVPCCIWLTVRSSATVTRGFGTLALILILFAAGLELDLRTALKRSPQGRLSRSQLLRFPCRRAYFCSMCCIWL